jgi:hypothetical protein
MTDALATPAMANLDQAPDIRQYEDANGQPPVPTPAPLAKPVPSSPSVLAAPPDLSQPAQGGNPLAGTVPNANVNPPAPHENVARHVLDALNGTSGKPGDWAKAILAGTMTAAAGFGAGGKVPAGAGALYGVGAAVRQAEQARTANASAKQAEADRQTELKQRQQELDLEKQKAGTAQGNADREYNLQLAENARQQAMNVANISHLDRIDRELDDQHNSNNFDQMEKKLELQQHLSDLGENILKAGGKVMSIAGAETPAFDDPGKMEDYASANNLDEEAHQHGYRIRGALGADRKWHLYEVPEAGDLKEYKITDASGKERTVLTDSLGYLNYSEKVAQTREANARANLTYTEANKALNDYKEDGTVKKARADLSKVDGDFTKLNEGDREALRDDAQKRYSLSYNAYLTAQKDMQRDPRYVGLPVDANGNVDETTKQYKDLADEYHVSDAQSQLGDSYDELRQLGHGYNKFGGQAKPQPKQQQQTGAPKKGDTKQYNGATYIFDGQQYVKQSAEPAGNRGIEAMGKSAQTAVPSPF